VSRQGWHSRLRPVPALPACGVVCRPENEFAPDLTNGSHILTDRSESSWTRQSTAIAVHTTFAGALRQRLVICFALCPFHLLLRVRAPTRTPPGVRHGVCCLAAHTISEITGPLAPQANLCAWSCSPPCVHPLSREAHGFGEGRASKCSHSLHSFAARRHASRQPY
jgi:hypothetical protein